jgi:hypothetical protein
MAFKEFRKSVADFSYRRRGRNPLVPEQRTFYGTLKSLCCLSRKGNVFPLRESKVILTKSAGLSYLILAFCFSALPGLAQEVRDERATGENVQHWLRRNALSRPEEKSAIFYVNKQDPEKILIFARNEVYLFETRYSSVVRVTSALPKTDNQFETGELTTEPLKDVVATVQPIAGTPKFAGGGVGLGWLICFYNIGKPPKALDCHIFARYQEPPTH